jgi:hypothetical protein
VKEATSSRRTQPGSVSEKHSYRGELLGSKKRLSMSSNLMNAIQSSRKRRSLEPDGVFSLFLLVSFFLPDRLWTSVNIERFGRHPVIQWKRNVTE